MSKEKIKKLNNRIKELEKKVSTFQSFIDKLKNNKVLWYLTENHKNVKKIIDTQINKIDNLEKNN